MQNIFKYISSLLFCLVVFSVQAQVKKVEKIKEPEVPMYNGFTVQVDAASLVTSALKLGEFYSMEGGIQVNLKKKYFPVFELGMGGIDKLSNDNVEFKTNGLFGRVGIDMNLIKKKKDSKPTSNLFLVGVRLGMSHFAYNITNIQITDNYWGGTESTDYTNQLSTKLWFEVVAGVHVEIIKNVFMGWTVRNKNLLGSDVPGKVFPYYIPGYGLNNTNNWAINYTLGYKF